jgi:hypothetical protein
VKNRSGVSIISQPTAIRFVIDIDCSADQHGSGPRTVGSDAKPQSAPKRCVASSGVSKSSTAPVMEYSSFAVRRHSCQAKRADICQGLVIPIIFHFCF